MSSHSTEDTRLVISALFSRFAAFYGHVWRSQFKEENFLTFAKKEWGDALMEFSNEVLALSVIACLKQFDMPPTLPQLMQVCRETKKRKMFDVSVKKEMPNNKDSEVAKIQLERCKAILGGRYAYCSTEGK